MKCCVFTNVSKSIILRALQRDYIVNIHKNWFQPSMYSREILEGKRSLLFETSLTVFCYLQRRSLEKLLVKVYVPSMALFKQRVCVRCYTKNSVQIKKCCLWHNPYQVHHTRKEELAIKHLLYWVWEGTKLITKKDCKLI